MLRSNTRGSTRSKAKSPVSSRNPSCSVENSADNNSQEKSKDTENKELTSTKQQTDLSPSKPSEVPTSDSINIIKVSNSDKLDNKPDNKLIETDRDLNEVVRLPKKIRSAYSGRAKPEEVNTMGVNP